jgi:asparagine synthase (glutamine-hydrolysing)
MRRLSIIDVEGGHQPISNEDETCWIVMNGEIYNYLELRARLERTRHTFRTQTDTEVLLHLYEEMGEGCLSEINGMFAFAIWDKRKKELFIAVDRLGIKPIYFHHLEGEHFYFSSELMSLLALDIPRAIDISAYLMYLFLLYVPYPKSIVKNVYKLEPASFLKIKSSGETIKKCYWQPVRENIKQTLDRESFKENFLELLTDAVKLQMRSDVPVGTFLSGGIDSSCIVAIMANLTKDVQIKTFSVGYEGHIIDERPYAMKVAKLCGTEHRELFITKEMARRNLERVVNFMDEPIGDSAAVSTFLLSEMAREVGVKVLLNGTGGDEIFGGYRRYLTDGVRAKAIDASKNLIDTFLCTLNYPKAFNRLQQLRKSPLVKYLQRISGCFPSQAAFIREEKWFNSFMDELMDTLGTRFSINGQSVNADTLMIFDIKSYLVGDLLFLLDKMTMGASIEGRVPLLDHRLVEFMGAISYKRRIENGASKSLVKYALSGILPDEILQRKKMGFGCPVLSWVSNNFLTDFDILNDNISDISRQFLRNENIKTIVNNRGFSRQNAHFLYNLVIFELWYKNVFSKAATSDIYS